MKKRVVVITALAVVTYFAIQHAPQASRDEDEVPDMSTICIVDTPAHVSSEALTADQLAILYASDGVRDKNGELVLSPLLERDWRGGISPAPGVQGPWRHGDLAATLPWYAPWVVPQQSDKGGGCQKATGGDRVPEPGTLLLILTGILMTIKWRDKMGLTEIGISEKLSNILADKGYKIVRIDTDTSEGEYYLKNGMLGSYEIYKAEFDLSFPELVLIVEPEILKKENNE